MISFDEAECRDFAAAQTREWLETNGLGGYASSTVSGMNTRRYHALLTAALRPPTDRVVLLSKLEETLVWNGERIDLSTNLYRPTTVHPEGYRRQTGFRLDPFPIFTFQLDEHTSIEKRVFMPQGENTTVVRYRLHAAPDTMATLELRPLVAFRDYHSLRREAHDVFLQPELSPGLLRLNKQDDGHTMFLAYDATNTTATLAGHWYRQFEYPIEQARGFDYHEDLFNPCALACMLNSGDTVSVIASTEQCDANTADEYEQRERERRAQIVSSVKSGDEFQSTLVAAGEQFIVTRGDNLQSIIAGYHWFTDWGRDTMISLHGLAYARGRFDAAREILLAFAAHINQGLIPNRFPDQGEAPEYNNVDGTLWFVHAVGELLRRTDDEAFVRARLYDHLKEIIDWHERGTHYGIRVAEDGLLRAGQEDVQLTWMDAKIGDYVVTPRTGKAVEIQALWYNALRTVEALAARFGDQPTRNHCRAAAEGMRASFHGCFWNDEANCLYDYIGDDGTPDPAIRPNQIFTVSLPHQILTGTRAGAVVEAVRRELLTPYGLRTLSPRDAEYRPRYEGDAYARDTAYHQGTVWAWLLGPFITAYLKVNERTPQSLAAARRWLEPFRAHLREAGVGQVSEIFDADAPHTPRGCAAQAWSVAELLRCSMEEL